MNQTLKQQIFIDAYLECMAWADCNEDNDPDFVDSLGFSQELLDSTASDCKAFLTAVGDKLQDENLSQAGHDFWLTRNGHGTGFWDRSEIYGQKNSDFFTSLCGWKNKFPEVDVYVGDDNLIYTM